MKKIILFLGVAFGTNFSTSAQETVTTNAPVSDTATTTLQTVNNAATEVKKEVENKVQNTTNKIKTNYEEEIIKAEKEKQKAIEKLKQ